MPPEDRRVRRTRRLLRDALVSLVLERGYAGITVEDITDRADLGRATFYSHYTDKDDLLGQVVSDLADDLQERLGPLIPASSIGFTGKPVLEMFRHAAEERDVYRVILRGEGDGKALRKFVEDAASPLCGYFPHGQKRSGLLRESTSKYSRGHGWVNRSRSCSGGSSPTRHR